MIRQLRRRLDVACLNAAWANPEGNEIEHYNHAILEVAHELGTFLRNRNRMSRRALQRLGNR